MKRFFLKQSSKLMIIMISLAVFTDISLGQSSPQDQRDNIDAQRIGFITKELSLSSHEAQVFWPVYNRYRAELEALRRGRSTELMAAKVDFDNYSDEEVNRSIENEFSYRQKELDLARRYNEEFKKILPVKKVAKLYRAEQLFKIYLLKDVGKDQNGSSQLPEKKN